MMDLPCPVRWALDALTLAGHEAWLVGGCVRDALMGMKPHDYDLATSASVEEMLAVFMGERVIETGLKHGTVTVLKDGLPLEITTYRSPEGGALTLREDLLHRDLTINAIAYHPEKGIQDLFGGAEDLRAGVIRAVEDPDARFAEDPLRLLRALRFASSFGFEIEARTQQAIFRQAYRLEEVSVERVAAEFIRLLMGRDVRRVLVEYIDVIGAFIPEALDMKHFDQRSKYHIYDVLEHTAVAVEHVPAEPVLRLAAFFHDIGKPASFFVGEDGAGHFYGHPAVSAKIANEVLTRLKVDSFTLRRVTMLVENHDRMIALTKVSVRKALSRLGPEAFDQLLLIKRADNLAQAPEYLGRQQELDEVERIRDEILEAGECFSQKDLALNGHDLMALGVRRGPALGAMLAELLDMVITGRLANTREALEKFVRKKNG